MRREEVAEEIQFFFVRKNGQKKTWRTARARTVVRASPALQEKVHRERFEARSLSIVKLTGSSRGTSFANRFHTGEVSVVVALPRTRDAAQSTAVLRTVNRLQKAGRRFFFLFFLLVFCFLFVFFPVRDLRSTVKFVTTAPIRARRCIIQGDARHRGTRKRAAISTGFVSFPLLPPKSTRLVDESNDTNCDLSEASGNLLRAPSRISRAIDPRKQCVLCAKSKKGYACSLTLGS